MPSHSTIKEPLEEVDPFSDTKDEIREGMRSLFPSEISNESSPAFNTSQNMNHTDPLSLDGNASKNLSVSSTGN
jgi:hypothetical protein